MSDALSLGDLFGAPALKPERLQYTLRLNADSPYFSMPTGELYGKFVEIEVADGKHIFKIIEIQDTWAVGKPMERKITVTEVK